MEVRWEDRHQRWFDLAVNLLASDLASTTGLTFGVEVDLSDPEGLVYRFASPDGGFHGESLSRRASAAAALVSVADLFADDVIEEIWRAWPPCAGHGHPAVVGPATTEGTSDGGAVAWACPTTGRTVAAVGEMRADLATVVGAYWQRYQLGAEVRNDGDPGIWAWEGVTDLIQGCESAMPLDTEPIAMLVALADGAPDDRALAYLGAGPIEDHLAFGRSAPDIDGIERAARRNRRFRTALRSAYFDRHLDPGQAERLRRLGPPP